MRKRRIDLDVAELAAILERASREPLAAEEVAKLEAVVETLAILTRELEGKGVTIARLRRLIFGASTERTSRVVDGGGPRGSPKEPDKKKKKKKKRKGHGRNGATSYRGAERVTVPHGSLAPGAGCPTCAAGKVYRQSDPAVLVRVRGMAPLSATVYACERYRCHLCGAVFTAAAPPGVGNEKYDETAAAMIGLLKYGTGFPFHRLERLEGGLGIPLPASTQWEVVRDAAARLEPAYEELVRQAAQGEVLHNDDTAMTILDLTDEARREELPDGAAEDRTGVFTSGIVSKLEGKTMAVFATGPRHAGENLDGLLGRRQPDRAPPIQMSDALSRNQPAGHDTLAAHCLAHARRKYVDVVGSFPEECRYVLETLREVYRTDAKTRALSPEARLAVHQQESGPRMAELEAWLDAQIDEHRVEPNSVLGEAIGYMREHWEPLTLFLRVPGAPLDNNICERALKKVILHRKNALFYRSLNGARVGDLFMSLIHTAELNGADPFPYLVALLRHLPAVLLDPAAWMPWTYAATLATLENPDRPAP